MRQLAHPCARPAGEVAVVGRTEWRRGDSPRTLGCPEKWHDTRRPARPCARLPNFTTHTRSPRASSAMAQMLLRVRCGQRGEKRKGDELDSPFFEGLWRGFY